MSTNDDFSITPETAALVALILPPPGSPSSPDTDKLYQMVEPVHEVIETELARLVVIQKARRVADSKESADYASFFHMIDGQCITLARQLNEAASALELACNTSLQIDKLALEMKSSLDTRSTRLLAFTPSSVLPPTAVAP